MIVSHRKKKQKDGDVKEISPLTYSFRKNHFHLECMYVRTDTQTDTLLAALTFIRSMHALWRRGGREGEKEEKKKRKTRSK